MTNSSPGAWREPLDRRLTGGHGPAPQLPREYAMEYRRLGRTDIDVSRVCLGTIWGLNATSNCTGSGATSQGKVSMAISQQLTTSSMSPGSGTVLKLDLACAALATELN